MDRVRVETDGQPEMIPCAYQRCGLAFAPAKAGQIFHSAKCRAAYAREVGLRGEVASVVKLMGGRVSVTFHFPAEAEARALALQKRQPYQIVKLT